MRREKNWWIENRTGAAILATDLDAVLRIAAVLPGVGALYEDAGERAQTRTFERAAPVRFRDRAFVAANAG